MAQTGGAAAYQRLTVPKDGTSQALQHWGSLEASKNAAKKLADERAAVRKAASDKAIQEKYKVDLTKFEIADAGYADENAANIALSEEIAGKYADTMYDAEQLALSGDYAGARELENKAKQLELQFGNEKQAMSAHAEQYKTLMGNASKLSGYSKGFENFYRGALTSQGKVLKNLNDDGEVIHVVDVEENGEVKRIVVPSKEVVDGTWRAYEKVDLQDDTTTVAESLGDIKREGVSGYNNTETIAWDDGAEGGQGIHSKAARDLFMAKLGSVDYASDMVDQFNLYEQFGIDEDNPEVNRKFTEDEKNVILDKIMPLVRAKYDETFSSKFNNSKYSTDASNARANKKANETTAAEAVLVKDASGLASQQLLDKYPNSRNGSIKAYTIRTKAGKPPVGLLSDKPNSEMLALVLAEDGTIHANYRDVKDVTDTSKEVEGLDESIDTMLEGGSTNTSRTKRSETFVDTRQLSDEEIARVATFYGVGDRQGLVQYLNSIGGETPIGKSNIKSNTKKITW